MAYTPVIPMSGYTGWKFVQSTYDRQFEAFTKSPDIERNIEYFRENIRDAQEVGDLIQDRRLLTVALGAFGLDEDINKPAWVRKVLEEGTLKEGAFALRLNSKQYTDFANAFGYGNGGFDPTDKQIERIIEKYRVRAFEVAVGEVNNDMRLALNFEREIGAIAEEGLSQTGGWFRVMGSEPLRQVVSTAFNLPSEFSQIDIDRQAEILADKAYQFFGSKTVDLFADPENVDKIIQRFQLMSQIQNGPSEQTPGYSALQILQSGSVGLSSAGIANLLLSNSS